MWSSSELTAFLTPCLALQPSRPPLPHGCQSFTLSTHIGEQSQDRDSRRMPLCQPCCSPCEGVRGTTNIKPYQRARAHANCPLHLTNPYHQSLQNILECKWTQTHGHQPPNNSSQLAAKKHLAPLEKVPRFSCLPCGPTKTHVIRFAPLLEAPIANCWYLVTLLEAPSSSKPCPSPTMTQSQLLRGMKMH